MTPAVQLQYNKSRFPSKEAALWWLGGIVDGEGNVRSSPDRRVRIRVCDRELIEACIDAAEVLNLYYKVYWDTKARIQGHSNYHEINFTTEPTMLFLAEYLPLQIIVKKRKLEVAAIYKNHRNNLTENEQIILNKLCLQYG